jgi:diguanylate cyclase (GGDEF)-like protein
VDDRAKDWRGESHLVQYGELIDFLQNVGKDPSRLIFEDELTGLHNRRFLHSYFEHKVHWDRDDSFPISLLVVDVDLFKAINDTYGHDAGDEALKFVATLIKEVAGENGYPVRFGGDEFMVLLPKTELDGALQQAHRLSQLTKERALELPSGKGMVHISLSIGVAAARDDATSGHDLIRKADTALYASKKLGRNRVSVARETDPEKTFQKTALHRLDDAQITGRTAELNAVSEALGELSQGTSKFLLLEGAPGIGKTTLIDTIRLSLEQDEAFQVVKTSGQPEEGYRPYYLIGQILLSLMNRRADKGAPLIDDLSDNELHYLGQVLPKLDTGVPETEESEVRRREGIFVTIVQLLVKLLDGKPLALLIDDLQFVDEGSLTVLRVLFSRKESSILACATVMESVALRTDGGLPPWQRFLAGRSEALVVERHYIEPLSTENIKSHLSNLFPGLDLPKGFDEEIAGITQGNPLFLAEIIRKLVLDQKLVLSGQRWTVKRPEEGYLPRSLEEIVAEKIAALDEEGRKVLEHVSTLGESVPVSMVTGASEISENGVLEFLDRAETLGLLRADFDMNDETMRFLSKRVLEIVYGSITHTRRQELHERVGDYKEELFRERLAPSASILAYHYQRSANQEKARRYDQLRIDFSQKTFNRDEAEGYTGEPLTEDDEDLRDDKLSAQAIGRLPNLFRTLLTTVRSIQLYPPDSKPIQKAHHASLKAVEAVLELSDHVDLARSQGILLANGHKVDVSEFRLLANSYIELLDRVELESIEFRQGLTTEELKALLTHLGQLRPEDIVAGYWKSFSAEVHLEHVVLRQMRYSEVRRRKAKGAPSTIEETELPPEDANRIPQVLRAILGAAKNIKLYPLGSRPVSDSIGQLYEELQGLLGHHQVITFAGANDSLLVNGVRLSTSGFEVVSENFLSFMVDSELTSLTFIEQLSREELEVFVGALKELSAELEPSYWRDLAEQHQLHGIAFNDRRYSTTRLQSVLDAVETDPELESDEAADEIVALSDEPTEALIEALPTVGKELLVKGEHELARKVLRRMFSDYTSQDTGVREKIIRSCRELLDALVQALQHQFAALSVEFLLRALRDEEDDHVLGELANLLYQMTSSVLQFADFTLAGRIFEQLRERQHALMQSSTLTGRGLAVMNRKLDTSTQSLLMEELRSQEPARQEGAAHVLESMGKPAIPLLIEVIKQEKDFRTRHLAAGLLAKMGREAADRIKREIVLEVTSEQRFRLLEVVDVITRDLKTELAFCLSDVNPKVRRAAFRLSERLNDKQVLELLVDFAGHQDIGVAKGAIRSLASLHSPHAVGALISALEVSKDPERSIACAQALAQLGDAVAVPALEKVLTARKFPLFGGKRWDDQVRATAAFALAQIGGNRAKSVLARVADDADPRIRQIAASGVADRARQPFALEEPEEDDPQNEDAGVA